MAMTAGPRSRPATPKHATAKPATRRLPSNPRPVAQRALATAQPFGPVQAKLAVGPARDRFEVEADRVADRVVQMGEGAAVWDAVLGRAPAPAITPLAPMGIQRLCAACEAELQRQPIEDEEEEVLQAKAAPAQALPSSPAPAETSALQGGGQPLSAAARAYFEPRFRRDFSQVRVHTGAEASRAAADLRARAFTVGPNIAFDSGEYDPTTARGRHLLAHELTHVVQQTEGRAAPRIQRFCSDPDFCTPFATTAEAVAEESWLRRYFLPAMSVKFGSEVRDLWEAYLSRTPASGLSRRVFATAGSPIEESFATSGAVEDDQEAVLDLVVSRLSRFPGSRLRPHTYTVVSLTNFLSASEMNDRPINFSNPLAKAGNIAGGIGSSAAGADSRKIARANVSLLKTPVIGNAGYIDFTLTPFYEVYDAIDFCPGQCGSPAEQIFTIPLSRLEAMGRAYDVPYVVKFQPEPETRREYYTSLPL